MGSRTTRQRRAPTHDDPRDQRHRGDLDAPQPGRRRPRGAAGGRGGAVAGGAARHLLGGGRLGAGAALWLGMLLVTYWWVADGGLRAPVADGGAVLALGQLAGLSASVLLLAQVLLMALIPVLERAFGQDDLARRHRLVGFTSFNLMLAHVVFVPIGYAGGDVLASPGRLWDLTVDYPGMLLAVAGAACLAMVVVTSIKAARR